MCGEEEEPEFLSHPNVVLRSGSDNIHTYIHETSYTLIHSLSHKQFFQAAKLNQLFFVFFFFSVTEEECLVALPLLFQRLLIWKTRSNQSSEAAAVPVIIIIAVIVAGRRDHLDGVSTSSDAAHHVVQQLYMSGEWIRSDT